MTDRYENIRQALEMGPTPGPWSFKDNRDGSINLFGDGRLISVHCRLMNKPANEAYISACDPDTIRALLEERDALREALETMVEMVEMNGFGRAYAMDVARAALAKKNSNDRQITHAPD